MHSNSSINNTFVTVNVTLSSTETTVSVPLSPGLWYTWWVEATNCYDSTTSEASFKTRDDPCNGVSCTNHGVCFVDENDTVTCSCEPSWTGSDCSTPERQSLVAVSLVAIPIFFLLLLSILVIALLLGRKRIKRIKLQSSLLERVKFSEVSFPVECENETTIDQLEVMLGLEIKNGTWEFATDPSVIPTLEKENVAKALIYAFEHHTRALDLMKTLISKEIATAGDESTLFSSSSLALMAFKVYARMIGITYLFQTLAPFFEQLLRDEVSSNSVIDAPKSIPLEEEGVSSEETQDEYITEIATRLHTSRLLQLICHSVKTVPLPLCQICFQVYEEVSAKFPEIKLQAIGSFLFLRFYRAAIVSPESYGFMSKPPEGEIRSTLIEVSKQLQGLVSSCGNPSAQRDSFSQESSELMLRFYTRICERGTDKSSSTPTEVPTPQYKASLFVLHQHKLLKHK
eukprot:TRINITY_DN2587_c0_g1_i2.p1 TRINITY_DN2587_c0_g1~~TRINITY_DN2587_c0_g1_i2.p1  ORF type:complete len:457 (-),score=57.66 TRINITY_DN2587_c0_g1_i2:117-1487(-)